VRRIKDRDYLESQERLIFTVVGYLHPEDRAVAYLKYIPSPEGRWRRSDGYYQRVLRTYSVPSVWETEDYLRKNYPEYLFRSEFIGTETTCVPLHRILRWYRPEEKLAELSTSARLDSLQAKSIHLAETISHSAGVPLSTLGLTGSIALGLHNPSFSDIDLTVYGYDNAVKVRSALREMMVSDTSSIKPFDGARAERWCIDKERIHPISRRDAAKILQRKWGKGVFQGSEFSVHPIRDDSEIHESYGDRIFRPVGLVTVEVEVTDSSESLFLPAIYKICVRRDVSQPLAADVSELVSFEGLYCDSAYDGERVLVRGMLEKVVDTRSGADSARIVVGAHEAGGTDFIRILNG
jgi:predicted nucleotidyltransferase